MAKTLDNDGYYFSYDITFNPWDGTANRQITGSNGGGFLGAGDGGGKRTEPKPQGVQGIQNTQLQTAKWAAPYGAFSLSETGSSPKSNYRTSDASPKEEEWSSDYDYNYSSDEAYSSTFGPKTPNQKADIKVSSDHHCYKCKDLETKLYDAKDEVFRVQEAKERIQSDKERLGRELHEAKEEIKKLQVQVRSLLKRI